MFIETLETRRHFSATILNGILTVTGSLLNDTITINVNPSVKGLTYFNTTVTVANAKGSTSSAFATSGIRQIVVNAGDGDDVVQITGNCNIGTSLSGEAGNDSLSGGDVA